MTHERESWTRPVLVALAASADARNNISGVGNVDVTYSGFPAGYSG